MPMIDMPVEELKKYQGRNPRPADFDEYWKRALQALDATDPAVERRPAKFQSPAADCYDLYFTGVGGARVYAKLLIPKNAKKCPGLLRFHGYAGSSRDWTEYLAYAASGVAVAAMDCRGQGGKSEDLGGVKGTTYHGQIVRGLDDNPDKFIFRQIFLDTAQLARIVMGLDAVDETRVAVYGGSQGGALTLACAALEPRIKLALAQMPFLCDYQRVWEMDMAVRAYSEIGEYFRKFDPRHEREQEIFTKLGYIDIQNLAPRIQAEVVMFTGLMDNVCPPSTQFAAYNKIPGKKEILLYPDYAHEHYPEMDDIVYQRIMGM